MNFWKSTLILLFALLTVFCVGYAHSSPTPLDNNHGLVYKTDNWAIVGKNCTLEIEYGENAVDFTVPEYTRLHFKGFYPKEPGVVEFLASKIPVEGDQTVQEEKLVIKFDRLDGVLHPVDLSWISLQKLRQNRALAPNECTGLKKIR